MCLIVYNKTCRPLNRKTLKLAHENNPHGFGFMWHDEKNDRVRTLKYPNGSYQELEDMVTKFEVLLKVPYVLHLRWRTRGKISVAQSHPHRIMSQKKEDSYDLFMMHNGTFAGFPSDSVRSDTKQFAKKFRAKLIENDHRFNTTLAEMGHHINNFDKIVFLDNQGNLTFVNESAGEWLGDGEVWVSNTYSFEKDYRKPSKPAFYSPAYSSSPPWDRESSGVYVARGSGTIQLPDHYKRKNCKRGRDKIKAKQWNFPGGVYRASYRVRDKDGQERVVEVETRS